MELDKQGKYVPNHQALAGAAFFSTALLPWCSHGEGKQASAQEREERERERESNTGRGQLDRSLIPHHIIYTTDPRSAGQTTDPSRRSGCHVGHGSLAPPKGDPEKMVSG